jgi:NagD protein
MQENHNRTISPQLKERLSRIRHLALDMDGTIYMGSTLFPFTKKFLSDMSEAGIGYSFLTNNPSRSVADYLKKLEGLGIDADEDNMYTTSLAAIDYIKSHYPDARRLFLLGTPSMISQFEKAGFESCADDPEDVPDVLVVAFDMTLEYSRLCRASWWASQNIPYIATNPDRVCPTDQPNVLVDCGSICKCIEHATGRKPDITLGKPDPNMLTGILERHGLKPEEVAMVGDRIYTDTAMAHNAGAFGVLVLSGETTLQTAEAVAEDARTNPAPEFFPPDLICRDIKELGELIIRSQTENQRS